MKLELTTDQVNQVLNALAQQPYIQVNELINSIQQQGQQQIQMEQAVNSAPNQNFEAPSKAVDTVQELVAETSKSKNGKG